MKKKKVFICWSKHRGESEDRGKGIAKELAEWLRKVVDGITPEWSEDTPTGVEWFPHILEKTRGCNAGIVCITPENINSPWIHFEAGTILTNIAMSQTGRGEVSSEKRKRETGLFTLLFGVEDLPGPLSHLQAKHADKEGVESFVTDLAVFLNGKEAGQKARQKFAKNWKSIEEKFAQYSHWDLQDIFPELEDLFSRKTFVEPFSECVDQRWLDRYRGIIETKTKVEKEKLEIKNRLYSHPYHLHLYEDLIRQVDSYAMTVGGLLLSEKDFNGLEEKNQNRCDSRRREILNLLNLIKDQYKAPVFPESVKFEISNEHSERKNIIQKLESQLIPRGKKLSKKKIEKIESAAESQIWGLDRIIFYIAYAKKRLDSAKPEEILDAIRREEERARSRGLIQGLQPLHYAVESLDDNFPEDASGLGEGIRTVINMVMDFISRDDRRDSGNHIRRRIESIQKKLRRGSRRNEM